MAANMSPFGMLQEPAYCRLKADSSHENEEIVQKGNIHLVDLLNLKPLHQVLLKESKLIHTLISVRNAQLRKEKSLQLVKRIKACLQRVKLLNRLFSLGADLLTDTKMFLSDHSSTYLPCRQSWTYMLYLISQYNKLLQKTVAYCITTFQFLTCSCTTRHLLKVIVMYMATTARVWQVCRALSTQLADVYTSLYSIQDSMKPAMSDWTCPDLPVALSVLDDVPGFDDGMLRNLAGAFEEPVPGESTQTEGGKENPSSLIKPLEHLASSSLEMESCDDSMEDIGVPISLKDVQKSAKRKLDPEDMAMSPNPKKKKGEKSKKMKKKKKNLDINSDGKKDAKKLKGVKSLVSLNDVHIEGLEDNGSSGKMKDPIILNFNSGSSGKENVKKKKISKQKNANAILSSQDLEKGAAQEVPNNQEETKRKKNKMSKSKNKLQADVIFSVSQESSTTLTKLEKKGKKKTKNLAAADKGSVEKFITVEKPNKLKKKNGKKKRMRQ